MEWPEAFAQAAVAVAVAAVFIAALKEIKNL